MQNTIIIRKILFSLILLLCIKATYGQKKQYFTNPFPGWIVYGTERKTIDSLNYFSTKIKRAIKKEIKERLTDFKGNLKFVSSQINGAEKLNLLDTVLLKKYKNGMPKYQLYFELTDTTVNFYRYYITFSFNENEELIGVTWPKKGLNKRSKFPDVEKLYEIAIRQVALKGIETSDEYTLGIDYKGESDKIYYIVLFLQKKLSNMDMYSTQRYGESRIVYKGCKIDAQTLKVISDASSMTISKIACTM